MFIAISPWIRVSNTYPRKNDLGIGEYAVSIFVLCAFVRLIIPLILVFFLRKKGVLVTLGKKTCSMERFVVIWWALVWYHHS